MDVNIFELLHIPELSETRNYWFVRSNSGQYYGDFVLHNYIAISWDYITHDMLMAESEEFVKKMIRATEVIPDNDDDDDDEIVGIEQDSIGQKSKVTGIYNKLIRFSKEMSIDDVVLVPSRDSDYVSIGLVKSDVYTLLNYAADRYKDDPESTTTFCPYQKRRNVQWVKTLNKCNMDIYLQRAFNSQHAVSNMNEYASYVDRALYSIYRKNNMTHATIHAGHPNGMTLVQLSKMIYYLQDSIFDIAEQCNLPVSDEDIQIKLNIHSPGLFEIIGITLGAGAVIALVISAINHYINGGSFNLSFKQNTETGIEFIIASETKGKRGHDYNEKRLDFKHEEQLSAIVNELDIKVEDARDDRDLRCKDDG